MVTGGEPMTFLVMMWHAGFKPSSNILWEAGVWIFSGTTLSMIFVRWWDVRETSRKYFLAMLYNYISFTFSSGKSAQRWELPKKGGN